VGIVCALTTEARHFKPGLRPSDSVVSLDDGTLLSLSGMGSAAAAAGARASIGAGAAALISFGLAGGLDPLLRAGDVCLPREILSPNIPSIAAAVAWRERVSAAVQTRIPQARIFEGGLLSHPTLVASIPAKSRLFASTRAIAVDMESFAVAEVAAAHRLPFLAVRVIVDGATDRLPPIVTRAADAYGEIRPWSLVMGLLRAPSDLAGLVRLGHRYRSAGRMLTDIARIGGWSRLAFP